MEMESKKDHVYASATNALTLWHPATRDGEIDMHKPRLLFLPIPFVVFAVEKQRTPFALHQFIVQVTVADCQFLLDWCIMASSREDATSVTTSALACTLKAALSTETIFHKWA